MASWNQNPVWTLIDLINNGNQIEPGDGFLASDMVKIVENLQYLYNNKSNATNLENGTDGVLIQTTDTNHSFKVMTDGRAKVQSAPKDNDDVVRKLELNGKLTAPTTPTAESAVTMLADGTVGTKPLSEFKEKIYDEDNNKQYTYQLKIKDGFPVLTMVEAEATI